MKKIMFNDRYQLTELTINKVKTRTSRIIRRRSGIAILDNVKTPFYRDGFCGDIAFYEKQSEYIYPKYKVGEVIAIAQCYKQAIKGLNIEDDYIFIGGTWHPFYEQIYNAGWNNKMFVRADFMPHQIKITNVRIERLQDISDEDCLKEGIQEYPCGWVYPDTRVEKKGGIHCFPSPRKAFAALIDAVSGTGTWEHNPFVFVYDYELIK